ncbi:putative exonuclease domain-containing protein At3g15140 [Apium graveolens]|uniref:putative exonuclease domain-containing protein At3g15140 n=1 Tax=Apium graveolens TaxID=4045 RepID=UPI003D7A10BD
MEILEFPVPMIDAKTLKLVDHFHRFVRPTELSEEDTNLDVNKHYPNFATNRVWHETAIPFKDVIQQFEDWLTAHEAWANEPGGRLKGAFVTCGNWDIKTKIPEQYEVAGMKLPFYLMQWINLKDIYLNFYNRKATCMVLMMTPLNMQLVGTHHLGIDDTRNIARVL